ncbi:hypothetical protein [Micromonospora sp. NBC_01796]|uniref:hypothetical protein n=1 Tax=Micromonospora sp. NBC_01796 TaxID=2975987 RepID=UPI002DDA850D|nr:hypothetical protein [Micromonospora sp. NBC_01796]WSA85158.1 hypothetical protein OIE47_33170 [Micromonospora sp. NBC_01796]
MDRDLFAARLAASAESAYAFARPMISEDLPAPLVFRIRLDQSYDGDGPLSGDLRFPADSAAGRAAALRRCDAAGAVAELWRDGWVPEWINVALVGETGTDTVVELVCCGRFTDDDTKLYHAGEGVPPFHVVGPALPPSYDETPFSIHTRTGCWDSTDLAHLADVSGNVWSFELNTDAFDDDELRALPDLPHVEVFEHRACALGTMSALARFPALRVLRLALTAPGRFHISAADDHLDTLKDLTITNLAPRPWGHDAIAEVAPAVTSISLTAHETLWLDGTFGPYARDISLVAPTIAGPTRMPTYLDRLGIHLTQGDDQQVVELLDGVAGLRSLSLRGTPVTDAVLPVLDRYDLGHLDLVDTDVSTSALFKFRTDHPGTGLLPRTPPLRASDRRILGRC